MFISRERQSAFKTAQAEFEKGLFFGLKEKMTDEQRECVKAILDPNINLVMINAKAGTGKNVISTACAKLLVSTNAYSGLVYIFAPVEESKMGFTPGDMFQKESKYHTPLCDALTSIGENPEQCIFDPNSLEVKRKNDYVWVAAMSHVFLRGCNLYNKVVIIDEAQNFTLAQLKKTITRMHDSCKLIIIGHTEQCDINNSESGFAPYLLHALNYEHAKVLKLTHNFRGKLATWADDIQPSIGIDFATMLESKSFQKSIGEQI